MAFATRFYRVLDKDILGIDRQIRVRCVELPADHVYAALVEPTKPIEPLPLVESIIKNPVRTRRPNSIVYPFVRPPGERVRANDLEGEPRLGESLTYSVGDRRLSHARRSVDDYDR